MKNFLLLLIGVFCLSSCVQSQISTGEWLNKENEDILLSIKKEDGKYWIYYFYQTTELFENGNEIYFKIRNEKYPVSIDKENEILEILDVQYIPVAKSMKGQFTGRWVNDSENTVFLVQLDGNVDLTWDIIKGSDTPIRFYPKRTDTGFHFTFDRDTLSYSIKDGILIDVNGVKYKRKPN